jgi:hypothetical protein
MMLNWHVEDEVCSAKNWMCIIYGNLEFVVLSVPSAAICDSVALLLLAEWWMGLSTAVQHWQNPAYLIYRYASLKGMTLGWVTVKRMT